VIDMSLIDKINSDLQALVTKHGKFCTVDGIADTCIIPWRNRVGVQDDFVYNGIFSKESSVANGSLIIADEPSYLVTFADKDVASDIYCSMVKCNSDIDVYRYGQRIDDVGDPAGEPEFILLVSGVIAYAEYVTASLRQQDIGLLATTEYILVVQKTVDIKKPNDPSLYRPDRVVLNGRNYQVDVVDDMKFPNLYHVQLSVDLR
jgi:hypothetical protein